MYRDWGRIHWSKFIYLFNMQNNGNEKEKKNTSVWPGGLTYIFVFIGHLILKIH
jgi:hypothetical protein